MQRGFPAILALITTGVIVAGAFVYLGKLPVLTQTTIESVPTPTVDETANPDSPKDNWNTFISDEYKFTLKYPSQVSHSTTLRSTKYNKSHEFFQIDGGTLEIYGVCGRGVQPIKIQDIVIDNQKTVKLYETNTSGVITAISRPNSTESVCFKFTLPNDMDKRDSVDMLFDQILSTFKFLTI